MIGGENMQSENHSGIHAVAVTISEDKLKAYMSYLSSEIGEPFTVEQLHDVLRVHGVKYGVLEQELLKFIADPRQYTIRPLLIAQGAAPQPGKDGYIHFLYQPVDESPKPQLLDNGKVDFREINRISNVKKGQVIAERIPAQEGQPGITVTGDPLPAPNVREANWKLGKNVVLDDEKVRMYAVIDGMVTFTDRDKVNVFPVFEVNGDVDYRTGNIDFVGNVVVRGNVMNGFVVKAEGDIRITGSVEGAEVAASGSIDILEGIVGHGKGFVKAGKSVKCSFILDGNVEAGEDVIVGQSIMHSTVRASKSVICAGAKGLIVGGIVQAGESIVARTVGNMTHTPTTLEVGVLPNERNELSELNKQLKAIKDNLVKTDSALKILEPLAKANQLTPDRREMFDKFRLTKQQLQVNEAEIIERIEELERIFETVDQAKVEIKGSIFGGSRIVIGRFTRFIKDTQNQVVFRFENGEITMQTKL